MLDEKQFLRFRPLRRADIQVKLLVMIEGHSAATMWVPRRKNAGSVALTPETRPGTAAGLKTDIRARDSSGAKTRTGAL